MEDIVLNPMFSRYLNLNLSEMYECLGRDSRKVLIFPGGCINFPFVRLVLLVSIVFVVSAI